MKTVIERSFSVNLFIMKLFHFYPERKYTRLYKVTLIFIYLLFTVPLPALGFFYFICDKDADMFQLSENAFSVALFACYITKLLPFVTNADEIKSCIHYFDAPFFEVFKENQKKIIDKAVYICRRNSLVYLSSIIPGYIFFMMKPFFFAKYSLPVSIWLPFDATSRPSVFYIVYVCMGIEIGYSSFAIAAIDPLLAGLACHAASQIAILKDNLQHLNEYTNEEIRQIDESFDEQIKTRIIYNKIKRCAIHYDAILKFVKKYEDCFSSVVFSQFVGSIFSICLCFMRLMMFKPSNLNFFFTIIFISIMLVQVYFYCYYGAELFEQNRSLADAIYLGVWYELDLKSKNALFIIMERSKRPMIITAGKLLDLSLETFLMILRRSYSLLAVLKNF